MRCGCVETIPTAQRPKQTQLILRAARIVIVGITHDQCCCSNGHTYAVRALLTMLHGTYEKCLL